MILDFFIVDLRPIGSSPIDGSKLITAAIDGNSHSFLRKITLLLDLTLLVGFCSA